MRYTIPLVIELDAESHAEAVAEVNEWLDLACGLITRQDFHRYAVTAEDAHDLDAPHILPEDYPLPPTRQLTDTERAVLRGMLP